MGIPQLDHLLRICSLVRTRFYDQLEASGVDEGRMKFLKANAVSHMIEMVDLTEAMTVWEQVLAGETAAGTAAGSVAGSSAAAAGSASA